MQEELIKRLILESFAFDLTGAKREVFLEFKNELLLLKDSQAPLGDWLNFIDEWLGVKDEEKINSFITNLNEAF